MLFLNWAIPLSYSASIVLDLGALPPLRMLVLMIGYLNAKDGYVKDNLEALLSVSKSLEI